MLVTPKNGSGAHRLEVLDLPDSFKKTLADRLTERRVVRHVPADMRGARLELKAWRVVGVANGRVTLRQRSFAAENNDPQTGARLRRVKFDHQAASKVVGLMPGKLAQTKSALVVSDNYGVAVLDSDANSSLDVVRIIRFHQVKKQLAALTHENGGNPPLLIRNGDIVVISKGTYAGTWRVFMITSAKKGVELDLGQPDTIKVLDKTSGHKRNVLLKSLLAGGLTVAKRNLTGI